MSAVVGSIGEAGTGRRQARLDRIPALDGIRAVALIAVLLFHSDYKWARGGYLGVTTFFVLSGFLITSLLLIERQNTGSIDLKRYWERRVRRLAPAVLVLVALVAVLVRLDGHPPRGGLVGDAVASLTWVANWRFVFAHRSYADLFAAPSPFQHMWSLSIEEQVYIGLPVLVGLVLAWKRASRRHLAAVFAVLIAASTAACALIHHHGAAPLHEYYGTDARAAEPLVGALLAVALVSRDGLRRVPRWAAQALGVGGVVGVVGLAGLTASLGERNDALYRGGFLVAALLSALVVAAATQSGAFARVFSVGPLEAIGRVSYGAYLFHWPIFLWLTPSRTGLPAPQLFAARTILTLGIAAVSYAVIEAPVRQGAIRTSLAAVGWLNASVAVVAALFLVTSFAPTTLLASGKGVPPPPPPTRLHQSAHAAAGGTAQAPAAPATTAVPSTALISSSQRGDAAGRGPARSSQPAPPTTAAPTQQGPPPLRVAVIGDSMARLLSDGISTWGKTHNVVAYDLGITACPISRGGTRRIADGSEWPIDPECSWWSQPGDPRLDRLTEFQPDIVVMQDGMNELPDRKLPQWPDYRHSGQPLYDQWLLNEYTAAIDAMKHYAPRIVFLNAVCADWTRSGSPWGGYEQNGEGDHRVATLNTTAASLVTAGATVGDFESHLCPGGKFTDTVDGVANARPDGYHLSADAALAVTNAWLGPLILNAEAAPAN